MADNRDAEVFDSSGFGDRLFFCKSFEVISRFKHPWEETGPGRDPCSPRL
jgi:hypothetical protein